MASGCSGRRRRSVDEEGGRSGRFAAEMAWQQGSRDDFSQPVGADFRVRVKLRPTLTQSPRTETPNRRRGGYSVRRRRMPPSPRPLRLDPQA
eukprot:1029629-Rhodomonas_salina.1